MRPFEIYGAGIAAALVITIIVIFIPEGKETDTYRQRVLENETRRKKEAVWWESRKEWVENFPYEPKYHPEMKFTKELLMDPVTSVPRPDPLEYQNRPGDLLQNMTDFETDYQA